MSRSVVRMIAGAGALISTFACGARAADVAPANPPAKAMYLKYCSACHGESGKGDGVVSGFMQPKPTDLTQIAKKNGGSFPFMAVVESIDGTNTVRAHGDPAMPVWGEVFRADLAASFATQSEVRGRVMLITEYLRSIQAK